MWSNKGKNVANFFAFCYSSRHPRRNFFLYTIFALVTRHVYKCHASFIRVTWLRWWAWVLRARPCVRVMSCDFTLQHTATHTATHTASVEGKTWCKGHELLTHLTWLAHTCHMTCSMSVEGKTLCKGHELLCNVMCCHVMSCDVMSCHVMSCHVMSCHVMSCDVMCCHVMSGHVMSCHVMLCNVMCCHVMSLRARPGVRVMTCWHISHDLLTHVTWLDRTSGNLHLSINLSLNLSLNLSINLRHVCLDLSLIESKRGVKVMSCSHMPRVLTWVLLRANVLES